MATSSDQLPRDIEPDIKPNLSTDKEPQKDAGSPTTLSPDDLKSAESGKDKPNDSVDGEEPSDPTKDSPFSFRKEPAKATLFALGDATNSKKRRRLVAGLLGGSVLGIVLIVLVIVLSFLGSLKYVHFATILRTVSFAQFTNTMSEAYSQTIFDAAVLDPNSTGSFNRDLLGDRSIFDIARGINPEAQLQTLGRSGDIKFLFNKDVGFLGRTTNSFEGVTIDGTTYNLDSYAAKLGKGLTYDDLSSLQKIQVRNTISSDIRQSLYNDLDLNSRDTIAALKGLQAAFGFKLVGFANYARNYLGKDQDQAENEAETESYNDVQEGDVSTPAIESENSQANSDAQNAKTKIETTLSSGEDPNVSGIVASDSGSSRLTQAASDATKVAGLTLVLTGYCTLNDLRTSAEQADITNQTDAVRQAALVQSRSDQIEAGDVNAEAVGGASASFDNAEDSSLYQADTGTNVTGIPEDLNEVPTLDSSNILLSGPVNDIFNTLTDVLFPVSRIPIVGSSLRNTACTAILNPVTQIGLAIGSIFVDIGTDGAGAAAGTAEDSLSSAFSEGLSEVLTSPDASSQFIKQGAKFGATYEAFSLAGSWLSSYVQKLDGLDYSGLSSNSSLFNQAQVGTQYMAQSSMRTVAMGSPITSSEAASNQAAALTSVRKTFNDSAYDRYLSVNNPFSLLGNIVASVPSSFTDIATDIQTSLPSLLNKIGSFFMNPTAILSLIPGHSANAMADASTSLEQQYNYFGVQQWGWSQADLNTIENDPNYALETNAEYVENPQNYSRLKSTYSPCYQSEYQNIPNDNSSTPSYCTEAFLSTPDALHWRKYELDKYVLTQLSTSLPSGS